MYLPFKRNTDSFNLLDFSKRNQYRKEDKYAHTVKALEVSAWSNDSSAEYKRGDLLQVMAPNCLCFSISKLWVICDEGHQVNVCQVLPVEPDPLVSTQSTDQHSHVNRVR